MGGREKVKRRKRKGKGFFFQTYGNITVYENLSLCKNEMPLRLRKAVNNDYPVNLKINARTKWWETRVKGRKRAFFTRYISEAMESSVVDVKTDEANDGTMARLTRCWTDESNGLTARIK